MRVAVFGLGYVGCVTAACLAASGHTVTGVDVVQEKVDQLNRAQSPVVEPGLIELIDATVGDGRLVATADQVEAVRDAEIVLIAVGTPTAPDGSADLSFLESVCQTIGKVVAESDDHKTVLVRSTVPPGTMRGLVIPVIEQAARKPHGTGFTVLFSPEFLREASAIADFRNPPYTVIGAVQPEHAEPARTLFAFLAAPTHVVDLMTAECVKYASNAFHALKVTFANEVARVFAAGGADSRAVFELFADDRELNISPRYLRPGFAFGGSCLPKDLRALERLAGSAHLDAPLIDGIRRSNEAHIDAALDHVLGLGVRTVAQFGLTFKSATDDLRESPYLALLHKLHQAGITVQVFDPVIDPSRLRGSNLKAVRAVFPEFEQILRPSPADAITGAECALIGSSSVAVYDAVLAAPPMPVLDLTGVLPRTIEEALRARKDARGNSLYAGVAW